MSEHSIQTKLCRVIFEPTIKDTTNQQLSIAIRLWFGYDKQTKKNIYRWANHYVRQDQTELVKFYQSLQPGDLISVEYYEKDNFINIVRAFKREKKKITVRKKV